VSKPSTSVGVKYLPLPRASNLSRCDGPQPAALRTAGSMLVQCRRCLPVGRPADVRSDARTPKHRCASCAQHFGSPSIGCGNRADSRLGRGSAAFVPDVQWRRLPGEPVVVFRWTVDRRALVASSGRTLRQGKGGCGGTAHFTRRSGAAGRGRSPDEPAADRSWCTVGPLVGFAFRPRQ
jgi:hypothetical protein